MLGRSILFPERDHLTAISLIPLEKYGETVNPRCRCLSVCHTGEPAPRDSASARAQPMLANPEQQRSLSHSIACPCPPSLAYIPVWSKDWISFVQWVMCWTIFKTLAALSSHFSSLILSRWYLRPALFHQALRLCLCVYVTITAASSALQMFLNLEQTVWRPKELTRSWDNSNMKRNFNNMPALPGIPA